MTTDTTARDKIAAKIRALKSRTMDRGCTEAEALSAANTVGLNRPVGHSTNTSGGGGYLITGGK